MNRRDQFMSVPRQSGQERDSSERIGDFNEYKERFTEVEASEQASRCMDCGTPFCHVGETYGQVKIGCPVYNLIPEWNLLVEQGNFKEALGRLQQTNNFPEFTGRVCPAPCEGSCTLSINEPAVTIKQIERTIIDIGFEKGWVQPRIPAIRSQHRIAIVGSGPAGLAAADQLNQAGHQVTVFEREDQIGGLLTYGIPAMKLSKEIVARRVRLLETEGIRFRTGVTIGLDLSLDQLEAEYDAVILCVGATEPRKLHDVPSRGVGYAMDYLTSVTRHLLTGQSLTTLHDTKGKDVLVIGGGDTGADCVATALRQGCRSVVQFGKHEMPGQVRSPENMWPDTPNLYTLDYGYEEALVQFGRDPREYLIAIDRYTTGDAGQLTGVWTIHNEKIRHPDGRIEFRAISGTEKYFPVDTMLIAIGFSGVEQDVLGHLAVDSENGKIKAAAYATNRPGVFAAGDARRGQSLIVWAIREGREVAEVVEHHLLTLKKTG
ncbi:glutamate synthase subunit beta [Exiguobacterium antarcticum]|uniref:glutamate synthase subunit beta n=1 Tax=Exiguobacterium antarcticum TaxID=132920 RepID=UPI000285E68F|nr:glutamate synthase subunit beta [Exiguobacterium antarcticum]AFS70688.1 Glutamate synthase [NADPH] small chain [Exiguobacterium antarcticum B7]